MTIPAHTHPSPLSDLRVTEEHVECSAWRSLWEGCPPGLAEELGLRHASFGDALALCALGIQHPWFNRVIGLGTRAPLSLGDVEAVVAFFREHGARSFWTHAWVEDSAALRLLTERGFERQRRAWLKLATLALRAPSDAPCAYPVTRARPEDGYALAELVCRAFEVPPGAGRLFAAAVGSPEWHVFVARDAATLVGAGWMHVGPEGAYLALAATEPAYRRRGVQWALLVARARAALALRVRRVVSETGEAVAGDPQHSQRNLERLGLSVVGVRANFGFQESR
jgi:ribosomal protein S18 acetylase RimI-like enzyme